MVLSAALTLPPVLAAERDSDMVRVGLAYGSGALTSANLENNTGYGSGYRLGYFDGDLDFVELARTGGDETQLTMLKTQNTWVNGSSYSSSDNGGDVIGCFHVLVEEGLRSYDQAAREAEAYRDGFVAWIDGDYQVRGGGLPHRGGGGGRRLGSGRRGGGHQLLRRQRHGHRHGPDPVPV